MARKRLQARRRGDALSNACRDEDPVWIESIQNALLDWGRQAQRDLPWLRDRDPYRVMVSEMMLVQTTVAAVVPYFERFVARFGSIHELARAELTDVLKLWEGLGYYRRARYLHESARLIERDHAGHVPSDPLVLRSLPGIGRYMAGAIASLAFDRPEPILEANTQRVLARLIAWKGPLGQARTTARLWLASGRLVSRSQAGLFNQAFMDLGATVCLTRDPLCLICPLAKYCQARLAGAVDEIPAKALPKTPLDVTEACFLLENHQRFLMMQRATSQLWEHFWEFPTVHRAGANPARRVSGALDSRDWSTLISELVGAQVDVSEQLHAIRYVVTKHRVTLGVHRAAIKRGQPVAGTGFQAMGWFSIDEIKSLALPTPMRRVLAWVESESAG